MSPSLETQSLRLTCLESTGQITGFQLEARQAAGWKLMSTTVPLSHLIYLDKHEQRHETAFNAADCEASDTAMKLRGQFIDSDDVTWTMTVVLALTDNPNQISADYRLEASAERKVLRWLGPCLYAGQGSFGSAKEEAIFPGLEYLSGDEPSSDTRFAALQYANRTVPHPYRIAIPLMAVSHEGCGVGLLWDGNQDWGRAWRHPSALFSSPNRLQDGAANHWMGLFAPGLGKRFEEGKTEAAAPSSVDANNAFTLSARFAVSPEGGAIGIVREWVSAYGLPALPDPGHDYRANIDRCVESYLDVAWDKEAEGWHHTLADPWGPRFEPILANQLWRYSRWPAGDAVCRARARDQVLRALPRAVEKQPPPHNVPRLELALVYGNVLASLDSAAQAARDLIAEQQADGSWGWTPAAVADIAAFKTDDRLAVMGSEQDSATGFTSSKVIPVLKYALATGDAAAVQSVIKAADWCNRQQRPEGAQTWELHLHVPDVLAVPYLINLNLGAYQLSGDAQYLDQAQRWAWTGLPFTFLWNAYYRPVMRYGTVPVFGVTFHDVQSWFGVIVHWNGLWYADALFRLAEYRRSDGPIDWLELAEGITRHGMQEQINEGPYKGMYPDAFSTVHGDEEYTWWLNPQLIGLNTFPLAGLPVDADSVVLYSAGGATIHLTSGAAIDRAHLGDDGTLEATLRDQPGETAYTLIALPQPPKTLASNGVPVPQVENFDDVACGWQWLAAHRSALVKTNSASGGTILRCK